ncbi:MAG: 3'-5' exonuclease, partial [Chlamydiia bacterium]|nr:3'-5' exonuclease [Chlamydiia bacterium]
KLQGKKLPDFPDAFKSFKRWVRERLPGTNHRAALIAWDAWDRDGLVFKTEAERHGKTVPHHWTWFSLSYAQKCVVRGFWDRIPEGTRDGTVGQLLNHYHITPSGCNVRDLAALYHCLLGYADQRELLKAMFEFPSVKPVAQVALSAQQTEPVFFDLETTGLIEYLRREDNPRYYVKDEKGNKIVSRMPEITQISAFFPTRLETVTDMELPPVAAEATEYSFAGLPQDLLPLHPGSVTLRIGEWEFDEEAIRIDYATGSFKLTFKEPVKEHAVRLTFTHEAKAWFNQYVRPEVPISPEAEEITGITLDREKPLRDRRFVCVSDCPTFSEVAKLFFAKVFEGVTPGKRPVLIAHNCWYFDKLVLENMCAKIGLEVKDLSWFDTLFLAAKVFGGGIRGNGINDLCNHYGITQREGHKADSDVAAMYAIAKKMFEGCDHAVLYKRMLEKKSLDAVYAEIRSHRPLPEFTCEEDEN